MKHLSIKGLKEAVPVMLGYLPVGIAFGLIGRHGDLPLLFLMALSGIVFAGASQFMAVNSLAAGMSAPTIIIATFMMNFRHTIMSMSIASRLQKDSKAFRPIIAFFVTDESYAVTALHSKLEHKEMLSTQVSAYLAWNVATIMGYLVGGILPDLLQRAMGLTLYILFAALLIPSIKQSRGGRALICALAGALSHYLLLQLSFIEAGWSLVIAMLIGALAGIFVKDEVK